MKLCLGTVSVNSCICWFYIYCNRFITAACVLDYNTLASADKFGNVALVRFMSNIVYNYSNALFFNDVLYC